VASRDTRRAGTPWITSQGGPSITAKLLAASPAGIVFPGATNLRAQVTQANFSVCVSEDGDMKAVLLAKTTPVVHAARDGAVSVPLRMLDTLGSAEEGATAEGDAPTFMPNGCDIPGECLHVLAVAVKADSREQGYGGRMIAEAVKFAVQQHVRALFLDSLVTSVGFYDKRGFKWQRPDGGALVDPPAVPGGLWSRATQAAILCNTEYPTNSELLYRMVKMTSVDEGGGSGGGEGGGEGGEGEGEGSAASGGGYGDGDGSG